MSHLFTLQNAEGSILFDNDKIQILHIESSESDTLSFESVKRMVPTHNAQRTRTGFRFANTIIVYKNGMLPYNFNSQIIADIDQEAVMTGNLQLQQIILAIKTLKGRFDFLDISQFFTSAIKQASGEFLFSNQHLGGTWILTSNGTRFKLTTTSSSHDEVQGVFFINEWESIYVPLTDETAFNKVLNKVKERSKLNGRICPIYMVVPTYEKHRQCVRVRTLENMKTDEMLTLFAHHKKAGTKVETLAGCLQSLNDRYVIPNPSELDKLGLVHINTNANNSNGMKESPIDIPPLDWVLCRASHLKTVYIEPGGSSYFQEMFVKLCKEPIDDFAQMLYTTMEQTRAGTGIRIAYIGPDQLDGVLNTVYKEAK